MVDMTMLTATMNARIVQGIDHAEFLEGMILVVSREVPTEAESEGDPR